jgi:DNA-binding LytR/AlgR family response regulator
MSNQNKFSCIIVDDEPIAIRVIAGYIEKINDIEIIGTFTNAIDALSFLRESSIDLIFLDIQMPGINGLELIKSIAKPPQVIFTTAFRNYAVDAFEIDAIDYLLKPIPFDRFLKAINKFFDSHKQIVTEKAYNNESDYLILKADKKNHKVKVSEILYIESLDDYVMVHTLIGKLVCYLRLSNLEDSLSIYSNFLRVHRSFIINANFISVFTSCNLEIKGKQIPIGRSYREQVSMKLNQ